MSYLGNPMPQRGGMFGGWQLPNFQTQIPQHHTSVAEQVAAQALAQPQQPQPQQQPPMASILSPQNGMAGLGALQNLMHPGASTMSLPGINTNVPQMMTPGGATIGGQSMVLGGGELPLALPQLTSLFSRLFG